jgi:hypothetical protein
MDMYQQARAYYKYRAGRLCLGLQRYEKTEFVRELETKMKFFAEYPEDFDEEVLGNEILAAFRVLDRYDDELKAARENFNETADVWAVEIYNLRYMLSKFDSPMAKDIIDKWPFGVAIQFSYNPEKLKSAIAFIKPYQAELTRLCEVEAEKKKKREMRNNRPDVKHLCELTRLCELEAEKKKKETETETATAASSETTDEGDAADDK